MLRFERSTKAIFKLMDVQHPDKHGIGPDSQHGRNLLNAISNEVTHLDFPEQTEGLLTKQEVEEMHEGEVARLMFSCEMYGRMYTLAAYGIEASDFNLSPNKFVEDTEYTLILESAVTGLRISDVVIDSIATGELPQSNRPRGQEGPLERCSAIKGEHYGIGKQLSDYDPVSDYRREL